MDLSPCCFAVCPDESNEPLAIFADLEQAMDWGTAWFAKRPFRVRRCPLVELPLTDRVRTGGA